MECSKCSMALQPGWQFCPKCGILLSRSNADAPSAPSKLPSVGLSVRAQVFEVIVRQAMAGAPWRAICEGPMSVNGITEEEIEEEVRRRGGGGAGGIAQKSPGPGGGGSSSKSNQVPKSRRASDSGVINEDLARENARIRQQFNKKSQKGPHHIDGRPKGN